MPRKLEETKEKQEKVENKKKKAKEPISSKKTTANTKKAPSKKSTVKKDAPTQKTTKAVTAKKSTSKKTASKAKATNIKKAEKKKKVVKKEPVTVIEYYDLPYRYNETVVKLLAQTPTNLFVYWDIADQDRAYFENTYGENFFSETQPVLVVHNKTKNYSFEIQINDFANSWYLNVGDTSCLYQIELGRRPKETSAITLPSNYLAIASSNKLEAPNDHILFSKSDPIIYQNVKTKETKRKSIRDLSYENSMKQIYNIYDLYQEIYQDENLEDFAILNPSSHTSSNF